MGLGARVSSSTALRAGEGESGRARVRNPGRLHLGRGFGLGVGSRPGLWVGARVGGVQSRAGLCAGLWNPRARARTGAPEVGEGPRRRSQAAARPRPPRRRPLPPPRRRAAARTNGCAGRRGAANGGRPGANKIELVDEHRLQGQRASGAQACSARVGVRTQTSHSLQHRCKNHPLRDSWSTWARPRRADS